MRAHLLAAGRALFASQGYEATTLQQVVAAAGTSIGNCYFYFADKEALLLAVAEAVRSELAAAVDIAVAGLEGPPRMAVALYTAMRVILSDTGAAAITLAQPSARAATVAYFTDRAERMFSAIPVPAGPPLLAAHAWQGAIFFIAEGVIAGRFPEDHDTVARFLVRWNLRAIGLSEEEIDRTLLAVNARMEK
ncbi:hypothetical protein CCAX7_22690 [Capsulimonas corticalis]|uniref:HTH tetR-type domain-containing protein n=2 Tax=Capsulimonas corticalis TaxID=2219043 RepID=A0A9N7L3M6_9BACT|nr:hypothetical protein CCAX7_22690 [Capsulimonas corticalis]